MTRMNIRYILPGLFCLVILSVSAAADSLIGRRITLDAGHGGRESGAVGLGGLREKDVNRDVVDVLKQMLEEAGAEVFLSREEDETVSLQDRVKRHKDWGSDLFVSVHHNANAQIDRSINRSEVYYHYTDRRGPSRDLAYETARRLHQKLGFPDSEAKVIHAYYVLRENDYPAILGEAAYISNPTAELLLRDPELIRLQAEGYCEAIVDFFDKGYPDISWEGIAHEGQIISSTGPFLQSPVFVVSVTDESQGVNPAAIQVEINGEPAEYRYVSEEGKIYFTSKSPLPGGHHRFRVVVQNNAGRYGLAVEQGFVIKAKPAVLHLEFEPEQIPYSRDAVVRCRLRVFDRHGLPIVESEEVNLQVVDGEIIQSESYLKNGYALMHFHPTRRAFKVLGEMGGMSTWWNMDAGSLIAQFQGRVTDALSGQPLESVLVLTAADQWAFSDRQGWFLISETVPGGEIRVGRAGYWQEKDEIPAVEEVVLQRDFALRPMFGGVLIGRSFVLDPEFGGRESGQVAPGGLRAADVNLHSARLTRQMLEAAGAQVELTRDEDATMSDVDRVRFGLARDFDWFISIRHAEPRPGENEPPELNISRAYARWDDAGQMARRFPKYLQEMLETDGADFKNSSTWEVMHASNRFQAIGVSPLFMTAPGAAERLERTATLRKEAQAILFGLVEYYAFVDAEGAFPEEPAEGPSFDSQLRQRTGEVVGVVRDAEYRTLDDVLIGLNDALYTATEQDGKFLWKYLDVGRHELTFSKPGYDTKRQEVRLSAGDREFLDVVLSTVLE